MYNWCLAILMVSLLGLSQEKTCLEHARDCNWYNDRSKAEKCCESTQLNTGCQCFPFSGYGINGFRIAQCPKDLAVKFHVYRRRSTNPNVPITLKSDEVVRPINTSSKLIPNSGRIHFIIHGYKQTISTSTGWAVDMKKAIFKTRRFDYVVIVDWAKVANTATGEAVTNTKPVGAIIANFIYRLYTFYKVPLGMINLIGYGLGAQVAAMAAQYTKLLKLGTQEVYIIHALNPWMTLAKYKLEDRLDEGDAQFVSVIYTDAYTTQPLKEKKGTFGNVEFWVNGGSNQPGCNDKVSVSQEFVPPEPTCSSRKALEYFTYTIVQTRCACQGDRKCCVGFYSDLPQCKPTNPLILEPNTTQKFLYCETKAPGKK